MTPLQSAVVLRETQLNQRTAESSVARALFVCDCKVRRNGCIRGESDRFLRLSYKATVSSCAGTALQQQIRQIAETGRMPGFDLWW